MLLEVILYPVEDVVEGPVDDVWFVSDELFEWWALIAFVDDDGNWKSFILFICCNG